MDEIILKKLLNNRAELDVQSNLDSLSEALLDFPYSQPLRLLYLAALKKRNATNFIDELKKAALYIADRKLLYFLLEDSHATVTEDVSKAETEPKIESIGVNVQEDEDKTLDLIDSFLSTLPEEEAYVQSLELSSDYTGYLLEETVSQESKEQTNNLEGQDLIDEFLRTQKRGSSPKKPMHVVVSSDEEREPALEDSDFTASKEEPETEDEGFFTETLAKIYVKQQRYDKALEILKKLSLKYPNKNAYFADQIRFLEKLIINDKSK